LLDFADDPAALAPTPVAGMPGATSSTDMNFTHQPTRSPGIGVRRFRDWMLATMLSLTAVAGWGAAEGAAASAQTSAASAVAPEDLGAFPLTEVFPQSERALSQLRRIRNELADDQTTANVEAELPRLRQQLETWTSTEVIASGGVRSVQQVSDLSWETEARLVQIDRLNALLVANSEGWVSEADALARGVARWEATRDGFNTLTPPAVRERVGLVLQEIEAVQSLYRDKINALIAAQSGLADQRDGLTRFSQNMAAVRTSSAHGLFAHDSPTLWAAWREQSFERPLHTQAAEGWRRFKADAAQMTAALRTSLPLHVLSVGALLGMALVLRWFSHRPSHVQLSPAEQVVIDRGVFSALLLSVAMVPLLHLDLGPRILRLGLLPAMVAVLALQRAVFPSGWLAGVVAFSAVFLLDFARNYLPLDWSLARLMLLAASTIGAGTMAWALWLARHRLLALNALLHFAAVLAALAFAGSLVANLTGNLSLAEYLISPPIRLVFIPVTIRLGVVVMTVAAVMLLRTPFAMRSRVIRQRGAAAAVQLRRMIGVGGVILWAYLALFNLGMLSSVLQSFASFMKIEWQLGATVISARELVIFLVVLLASALISRVLRLVLAEEVFPRFPLPRGVPDALVLISRYGVLLFGFLLALSSAGVDLSKVTLALSALGVGIGFGLQNVVNNFVCGLILVFEHPIQVGDYIEVGPHYGRVTRIGFRSSMVLIRDGSEVVIPNSELIGNKVVNWSLSDANSRLSIAVPVSRGENADRVIELLVSVAAMHPEVQQQPPPRAVLSEINDRGLEFTLLCWVSTEARFGVRDELRLAIEQAFRDAHIQQPVTQANLHLYFPEGPPANPAGLDPKTRLST